MYKQTRPCFAIVLGSGITAEGTATAVTEIRARAAAEFIKAHPMRLILSGKRAPSDSACHGCTEASAMAEIIAANGVERQLLLLEDQSFDTLGNAVFSARRYLAHETPGTLYVITSPFHMQRSLYVFRKVLGRRWKVVPQPAPEWSGETRQAGAPAAMKRAQAFFRDIRPGDLKACEQKLLQQIPAYKDDLSAA